MDRPQSESAESLLLRAIVSGHIRPGCAWRKRPESPLDFASGRSNEHLSLAPSSLLKLSMYPSTVGIAGVNTRPLQAATLGIAGNWGSTLRPHLNQIALLDKAPMGVRFGDQAAVACWSRASSSWTTRI
jgi:hypothetical protein